MGFVSNKDGRMEEFMTDKHPKREELGKRVLPLGRTVYIQREDFLDTGPNGENPIPPGFKSLVPGGQACDINFVAGILMIERFD